LPRLNSILRLKELGLSLEQIGPLLKDDIFGNGSARHVDAEAAEVERSLRAEETRLRHIESRIAADRPAWRNTRFRRHRQVGRADALLSLHCTCADQDEVSA